MADVKMVKAKVVKSWTHRGEQTKVGDSVKLTHDDYQFCLSKKVVDESPDAPNVY